MGEKYCNPLFWRGLRRAFQVDSQSILDTDACWDLSRFVFGTLLHVKIELRAISRSSRESTECNIRSCNSTRETTYWLR
jgi:hypothetical protein